MKLLRGNFIVLSLLNMLDAIFTSIGLSKGAITEANPIMRVLWDYNPLVFLVVKCAFSVLLVILFFIFNSHPRNTWKWNVGFTSASFIYLYITFLHLQWFLK